MTKAMKCNPLNIEACDILYETPKVSVMVTNALRSPELVRHIGYLREKTFRAVGKGTGQELDIDDYDNYYHQLILWDKQEYQVIGAYRFVFTEQIFSEYGLSGLYSSSLYTLTPEIEQLIHPGIELGRSFIVPAYQKDRFSLSFLWTGLFRLLRNNPQIRCFFGMISISNNYQDLSRELLLQHLQTFHWNKNLEKYLKGSMPYQSNSQIAAKAAAMLKGVKKFPQLNSLVKSIEPNAMPLPSLFKQYASMSGTYAAPNIDPLFKYSMDFFITCYIEDIPTSKLNHYMRES